MEKKENERHSFKEFVDELPTEQKEMLPLTVWTLKQADSRQNSFRTAVSKFYRNDSLFCNGYYKPISRFTKYVI